MAARTPRPRTSPHRCRLVPALCRSYPKPVVDPGRRPHPLVGPGVAGPGRALPPTSGRIISRLRERRHPTELVTSLLGRFEAAAAERLTSSGTVATSVAAGNGKRRHPRGMAAQVPTVSWTGHLMTNPASILDEGASPEPSRLTGVDMVIHLDTAWDNDPRGASARGARADLPLVLSARTVRSRSSTSQAAPAHVRDARGHRRVTSPATQGRAAGLGSLRQVVFGEAHYSFTLAPPWASIAPRPRALPCRRRLRAGCLGTDACSAPPDPLRGPGFRHLQRLSGHRGPQRAVHLDHSITLEYTPEQMLGRVDDRRDQPRGRRRQSHSAVSSPSPSS